MIERSVDMAAVGRVAKRVNLVDIKLTSMSATREHGETETLQADVDYQCRPVSMADGLLEIECLYQFKAVSQGSLKANAELGYTVVYALVGDGEIAKDDLEQFATANGAYHSWPFVRETLFGVTSKMGFPPYVLPVLVFNPSRRVTKPAPEEAAEGTSETREET